MSNGRRTYGVSGARRRGIGVGWRVLPGVALAVALAAGCDTSNPNPEAAYRWTLSADAPASALLSVHGTSADNVYAVGADDGHGPLVLHWDGSGWARISTTGITGDFWWVNAIDDVVFFSGSDADIVRYANGTLERMTTPGLGKNIVFGLWAASANDVYAVGSKSGRNGFIWHYDGTEWSDLPVPSEVPQDENHDIPQFVKVWGTSATDIWVVGEQGVILRGNATDGFTLVEDPSDDFLFTVHGVGDHVVAVGANGVVLNLDAQITESKIQDSSLLQGVCVTADGEVWATGASGGIYRNRNGTFAKEDTGITRDIQSLHAVWVDPDGGVWAVGGNVLDTSLANGVLLFGHPTRTAPALIEVENPAENPDTSCPAAAIDPEPGKSIARRWNEQILNAIRRDVPRPTVHARNLFHLSAAMWDAWAAYDATADGYLVREKLTADDVQAAREEAISYAAYRILAHRYNGAIGGAVSESCFDAFMAALGYDPEVTTTTGDTPAALGNRIGQAYIEAFAGDGANEQNNYADPAGYITDIPRLTVDEPGANTTDATKWQQLILAEAVTQNGIPTGAGVQGYIGSHWRDVTPFALERPGEGEPYFDLPGPMVLNDDLVDAAVEVLRRTAALDVENGVSIDISPGAYGNNSLGTNDGAGHPLNPITGEPYAPDVVLQGDFARVLAEFWADGPASETPPGHWNTLANDVADAEGFQRKLFGAGEELDPLAWDVHVYLALNGAVHDAAIAAWELKRVYLSARPITLIRTMAKKGQRSDPNQPSYDPQGIPLEPGLIEVITAQSSAPGERHAHLARYVGEIAVYSWRGEPGGRKAETAGVGWIRALDWVPYQRRTFVTPAFPGFVSGHSTFSRSAAEVLAEITGSEYFPGGLHGYVFQPGSLGFEKGPTAPVMLQWATYYDAADQAGQSRLYGGIHVRQDDFGGRIIGSQIGVDAIELARTYFDGSAVTDPM